jgi:hypothetical protein
LISKRLAAAVRHQSRIQSLCETQNIIPALVGTRVPNGLVLSHYVNAKIIMGGVASDETSIPLSALGGVIGTNNL